MDSLKKVENEFYKKFCINGTVPDPDIFPFFRAHLEERDKLINYYESTVSPSERERFEFNAKITELQAKLEEANKSNLETMDNRDGVNPELLSEKG